MGTHLSVDLDDAGCYHAIHGLPAPEPKASVRAMLPAIERLAELLEAQKARATFFVIGRTLEAGEPALGRLLRELVDRGHELGNHSYSHDYRLGRRPPAEIADDLRACDRLVARLGGAGNGRVKGFRAPGYTSPERLRRQVGSLGYEYDSSTLPSPSYYAAKLAAMGLMRVKGRRSASESGGARSFFASSQASYDPVMRAWKLPVSVVGRLRLPVVGTFFLSGPGPLRAFYAQHLRRMRWAHLQLHAVDLSTLEDGYDPVLKGLLPELQRPLDARLDTMRKLLSLRSPSRPLCEAFRRGA